MKTESKVFRVKQVVLAVAAAVSSQTLPLVAHAGAGWGNNLDFNGQPIKVPTYYANSPSGARANANPANSAATVDSGTALRKFVDGLPGLGPSAANNLGQYLPVAVADTASYPGSDYYEIALVEYQEKMHSDLPKATTLRGYVQIETSANTASSKHVPLTYPNGSPILDANGNQMYGVDNPHYLGPVVLASRGVGVRYKFYNLLPTGTATKDASGKVVVRNGDLFLPVDKTILGANAGPDGTPYTENRGTIHLHGGDSPWISDGTPHQWTTPRGETTSYKKGVSVQNVPDMPDPGDGAMTFYYPNNQSARLMFYHDHASGITRLNVYGGEAAGYVILDSVEAGLIGSGVIPGLADMIPLVIQDKTFVPKDIAEQDARWDTAAWGSYGDLWFPHVYETNQDPNSFDGTNPVGRWDYGPWFWPIFPAPLALPTGVYGDVTTTPEAFMDTPVVNGTAYPTLTVQPKAYRFRILNACNDRMVNLGLYVADPSVTTADGRTGTEVKMVPAAAPTAGSALPACAAGQAPPACWPDYWPTDGRAEGVPDPATVGPDVVVIGNEGGFIPHPQVIPSSPIVYEMNRRSVTVLNVLSGGLFLGSAERADVVIDFSQYAGKTLIVYNDSPAPVPAFDPRIDYFTNDGDQTGSGGAESTKPGYGPNTRTVMQIKVAATGPAAPFSVTNLAAALPAAYGAAQIPPVVGESAYNASFPNSNFVDTYAKIRSGSTQQLTFNWTPAGAGQTVTSIVITDPGLGYLTPPTAVVSGGGNAKTYNLTTTILDGRVTGVDLTGLNGATFTTVPSVVFQSVLTGPGAGGLGATAFVKTTLTQEKTIQNKAIQELFETNYGRMNATLGIELPMTTALTQTTVPLGYVDPATEFIADGETQIWKITHNGVDTHPVHFHLMNVQLINRVGWDGTIKPPKPNELGWKETIKMHPLEDIIVAISPKTPKAPFGVPLSSRYRDPAQTPGGTAGFTQVEFNQASPNFGQAVPGGTVANTIDQYQWEYVWHCHILGHEENDFMRPLVFNFGPTAPDAPSNLAVTSDGILTWTDATPWPDGKAPTDPTSTINLKSNEIYFGIERVQGSAGETQPAANAVFAEVGRALANATTFTDNTMVSGNLYWYRVVAHNAVGTGAASTPASTTASGSVPTAPANLVATTASPTVVNLSWTDNSNNESGFLIQRCPANSAGTCTGAFVSLPNAATTTTTAANVTTYSDATVAPNSFYIYQIFARNAAGLSTPAVQSNLVNTGATPAMAPGNLAATTVTDVLATLTWKDNSTAANPAAGFLVQRSPATGTPVWIDVGVSGTVTQAGGKTINITTSAAVTTYTDTGLTQNTAYIYRVLSVTTGGGNASAPLPVTTLYSAAPAVGTVTASPLWNQVSLGWPVAAPSTSFSILRSGGTGPTVTVTVPGNAVGATTANAYVDTGVVQNTAYSYTVTAINGPNTGVGSTVSTTTAYAPAPALTSLSATVNGTTQVSLAWAGAAANTYTTGLRVLRCVQTAANFNCTAASSVFTQVYSIDAATLPTGWIDTGVLASTNYTYRAYFVNGPANIGVAATATASVPASFAVNAPTNLTATLTNSRVQLSWLDNSTNETAFVAERSTDGINFAQIGQVAAATGTGATRTFNDTAIAPGLVYQYRVKAINVTGASTTSSAYAGPAVIDMTIGVPTSLTAVVTATQVQLGWTDNSTNETGFAVFRSADGGATWMQAGTAAALAGTGGARTFNDNALALIPGASYQYYVVANWTFNTVAYSSARSGVANAQILPLSAPTNLTATINATAVGLTWTDNASNETRFVIDRSSDGGVTWTQLAMPAARNGTGTVTYSDTTVATGNIYQYRVRAENVTGAVVTPSAESNVVVVDYALPAAPATVAAAPGAAGTVVVTWTDSADNESGYTVQRRTAPTATAPNPAWTTVANNVAANSTTWSNTGLTSGRRYQYQVQARNALGTSAWVVSDPVGVLVP
jgi:FtsP/CotA-like multicopper oxidase with cupredoxin domain